MIDGYPIDHEPPIRIITELSEDGRKWEAGEEMEFFDPLTGEIDLVHAPDEVAIEIEGFNRRVITESFNRVVCEQLAEYIDPFSPEKTLIFRVKDGSEALARTRGSSGQRTQGGVTEALRERGR